MSEERARLPKVTGDGRSSNRQLGDVFGTSIQAGSIDHLMVNVRDPTPTSVPRQVPPASRKFTNRLRELGRLDDLLAEPDTHGPAVAVLSGLIGVGKSAVASQWASRAREHFADGELYVPFKDLRCGGGVAVSEVLRGFLRGLGVGENAIPSSFDQRVALFRSVTASKRLLVLLDDAVNAAEVTPLIPNSSKAVVLVTAYGPIDELIADGAELVEIDPLDLISARALFVAMLGADRVLTQERALVDLLNLCSGLPVALAICAGWLVVRRGVSMSDLVARLRDEESRLDGISVTGSRSLRTIFDVAYDGVTDQGRECYAQLGLHVGPEIGVALAADLTAGSDDQVHGWLQELVERGLLQRPSLDRFRLHDLLWAHARSVAARRFDTEEHCRRRRIVVEWYLGAAVAADLALIPDRLRLAPHTVFSSDLIFDSPSGAFDWFEVERANIIGCVQEAVSQGWFDLVWRFCESLWLYFLNRKVYLDWIETHLLGIAAASELGDGAAEARVRSQLARAYIDLGRLDEADAELEIARELALTSGNARLYASTMEFTGCLSLEQGSDEEAVMWLSKARKMYIDLGQRRAVALQDLHLGRAHLRAGRLREADAFLRAALAAVDPVGDAITRGKVLIELGHVFRRLGNLPEAEEVLGDAASLMRQLGVPFDEATANAGLGEVCALRGNQDEANRYWREAYAVFATINSPAAAELAGRLGVL